ncbi:site-specific integrase [Bradyrhizobium sp. Mp27]|uniref:tyrosine-type recombinase/integrase n=1 Tax=Bradyrhizobium sp. Mp27 TaxID=3042157 RepID=UPI00248C1D11|nr:site-specific integrase [Bradyrhizobium sp. Mp27]MDI2077947.1 site-specific integrase [Bradyrhizobium sp. Mp27]
MLGYIAGTRYPVRNRVIVLLSVKAGLRAKEIASLTWGMVSDATGQIGSSIHLPDIASKGRSGRVIPINRDLLDALVALRSNPISSRPSDHVITTERAAVTSAHAIVIMFARWFREMSYSGCSSHSGRRTFITNAARRISTVGGSLRDVQMLAGHSTLSTTQRYIEADSHAQRKIVDLV